MATKDKLVKEIEEARTRLNNSIDSNEKYEIIYEKSIQLDQLIEQYIVSGF